MTIDEVIAKHRKIAKTQKALYDACTLKERNKHFLREAEEHEQLAEWLEELKAYRAHIFSGEMTQKMLKEEYNKAIDDFVNTCKEDISCQTFGLHIKGIERIAEQLKAGGKNERSI